MPAAFAISSVGVPCKPRAAKTRSAATRMASRRSSAVERVRVGVAGEAMDRYEYALTHFRCQEPYFERRRLLIRKMTPMMRTSTPAWIATETPFGLLSVTSAIARNKIEQPKKSTRLQRMILRSTCSGTLVEGHCGNLTPRPVERAKL